MTTALRVTVDGKTHTLREWAAIKGWALKTMKNRIDMGWDPVEVVTAIRKRHPKGGGALPLRPPTA